MGLPSIDIIFKTQAADAVRRSSKGVIGMILKDTAGKGEHVISGTDEIPEALSVTNQDYIKRAFIGYVNPPRKVIAYVLDTAAEDLSDGLAFFETQTFDYLVGPPDLESAGATEIADWIKAKRTNGFIYKAVLPQTASNHEAIINFDIAMVKSGTAEYTAAQYCSRIAGLIAGTPMTISCTFAALPELNDCTRLSKSDMDTAIDAGKLIVFYDGEKVKIGRGINSLTTTTPDKGDCYKKIKIVEIVDMISQDIKTTVQDNYIGKYANSYDNKCLLIAALKSYFETLEQDGLLESGTSEVGINMAKQIAYLKSMGVDTDKMSEQEIKNANTGDKVFLQATIRILDAMEDITLDILM